MAVAGAPLTHATSWRDEEEGRRYERGRPGYPAAVAGLLVDRLGVGERTRVLDVAAGTGKLTRLLTATGARVGAVEPMPGMRSQLRLRAPGATVLAGRAEALPVLSGSVDLVTVAQAFHWFDVPAASAELHRVLRPGGTLALVTNRRHAPDTWVRDLWDVLRRYEAMAPRPATTRRWRAALDATGAFGPFERTVVPNEQHFADLDEFDARFLSISFVILLPPERRAALLADLHAVAAGIDPLVVPLLTDVELAVRRA